MTALVWMLLTAYAVGVAVFLIEFRDRVLGGWFQAFFTALAWPLVVVFIVLARWGGK